MLLTTAVGFFLYTRLPPSFFVGLNYQLGNGWFAGAVVTALLGFVIGFLHWLIWRTRTGLPAAWMLLLSAVFFFNGIYINWEPIGAIGPWVVEPLLISIVLGLGVRKVMRRWWIAVLISTFLSAGYNIFYSTILRDLLFQSVAISFTWALTLSSLTVLLSGGVIMPLFFARRQQAVQ
jgi:hypothetical protein